MPMEYEPYAYAHVHKVKCEKCGYEFNILIYAIRPKCPKCKHTRQKIVKK